MNQFVTPLFSILLMLKMLPSLLNILLSHNKQLLPHFCSLSVSRQSNSLLCCYQTRQTQTQIILLLSFCVMQEAVTIQPQKFQGLKPRKTQLCRFYLRGLCLYSSHDCYFSHGIWDLIYTPWQEGEVVIYDYSKVETKQTRVKGERNYKSLYEYQREKIFTLEQINNNKEIKDLVRNQMHTELYNDFMDLLQCYYPDALFTEHFLLREFTRVGLNKLIFVIKLSHICGFVCDPPSSRFFKVSLRLPPHVTGETNYILPCLSDEENLAFYKEAYERYMEQNKGKQLVESDVKKHLFAVVRPNICLQPLTMYLKSKKMSFVNFLNLITNNKTEVIPEADQQTLLKTAGAFIQQQIKLDNYCSWSDVYQKLSQEHKFNNGNITTPLKPLLIAEGFMFLNFPMLQLITTAPRLSAWHFPHQQGCRSVCNCPYKEPFPQEELLLEFMNLHESLPPKQSFDIFDMDTLLQCASALLNSRMLAVDIEGRLRKNGYIEMIQINTGTNTFLIDVHRILMNGDMQTFQLAKKVLRNVFCDQKILKIFHDCRHDSLVLHEIINTCVVNIFDTSAVETFIGQLDTYQQEKNHKQILKTVTNVRSAGLNDLLKKYNAPHGINPNKQWFHQLWKKGKTELFEQRPLHPDYREYCIKDVLDLPYLHKCMAEGLSPDFTDWVSSHYVKAGYAYLTEGE